MFTKRALSFTGGFARKLSFTLGFTLIEMGIVLVVLGLVAGGSIALLGPVFDARRAELTTQRMDVIQKALQLYVIQNGCLPCPTDGSRASTLANAGTAMTSGSVAVATACVTVASALTCQFVDAVVPWTTLGLSEQDITDGWGDRIRYAAAGGVSAAVGCPATAGNLHVANGMVRTTGASGCYPAGNLTVDDIDLAVASDTTNAAYVLISSGPDQALALRAKTGGSTGNRWTQTVADGQFVNSDGNTSYASGLLNANTNTSHFDDITRFQSAPNMIQLCGAGACGNPS